MPWQEKCNSRRSSGERSVRNSSTASLTTWAGSFSSVRTSKPPISGSLNTAARASASAAGARSSLSPTSWYSSLATINALRRPRADSSQDPPTMISVWRRAARVERRPSSAARQLTGIGGAGPDGGHHFGHQPPVNQCCQSPPESWSLTLLHAHVPSCLWVCAAYGSEGRRVESRGELHPVGPDSANRHRRWRRDDTNSPLAAGVLLIRIRHALGSPQR